MKKWKCTVCGYIHEGEQPPEECPLCKAPKEKFVEVLPEGAKRRWRCTVCGYIHEGEQPPEECPLCKAPKEKFEELTVAEPASAKSSPLEVAAAPVVTSSRRWRCLVCGHTHQGPTPPPTCPVCKAPADQFGEIDQDGNLIRSAATAAASAAAAAAVAPRPGIFARMIMALHLHPISVHFPNGLLPVVLVFLSASVFLKFGVLAEAAYFNMIFVLATMPLVLLTGYIEWQKRYRGARSFLFLTKITCSMVVTVSLIVLVVWWYIDPSVAKPDSPNRLIYLIIAAVMVGAAGIAGHLGGHLVFSSRGK